MTIYRWRMHAMPWLYRLHGRLFMNRKETTMAKCKPKPKPR